MVKEIKNKKFDWDRECNKKNFSLKTKNSEIHFYADSFKLVFLLFFQFLPVEQFWFSEQAGGAHD